MVIKNKPDYINYTKYKSLSGKKAFITGGTKGIGWAIAKELSQNGVVVYVCGRDKNRVEEINESYYGNITAIKKDVEDEFDILSLSEFIQDVDILINNVGGGGTWKSDDWDIVMYKNYQVMCNLTMAFLKGKKDWGRVITIASLFGKQRGPNAGFAAAKAAQINFMNSLGGTFPGITFNSVAPGHIDVGKPMPYKPKVMGKPEDIGNVVAFLCSDNAKHINGSCIAVDGGETYSI